MDMSTLQNSRSSSSSSSNDGGGCIILLGVPPKSSITIDGITRLTPSSPSPSNAQHYPDSPPTVSSSTNNGVLIVSGIPTSSSSFEDQFHLLIVRCGSTTNNNNNQRECDVRQLPIGFILTNHSTSTNSKMHTKNELGYDWIFARRYDPQIEEISNVPMDELTLNNLLLAMRSGGELAVIAGGVMVGRQNNIVMSYDQFMMQTPSSNIGNGDGSSSGNADGRSASVSSWCARTTCINATYLQRRHGVTHGDKIVPSSYDQDENDDIQNKSSTRSDNAVSSSAHAQENVDGKQLSYPQIPCIDPNITARRLMQHAGTRMYLSKLSPHIRTKLLLGEGDDETFHAGEYVWNDIQSRVYVSSSSSNGNAFLADVQLSFLMFLFLECHTSLEHWRDAISMCSLAVVPTKNDASKSTTSSKNNNNNLLLRKHSNFFQQLLTIIHDQFLCIETEFFQEVEYSSGQKNFLIQALERLCGACDDLIMEGEQHSDIDGLKLASFKLKRMLRDRFQFDLSSSLSGSNDADIMEVEEECPPIVYEGNKATVSSERNHDVMEHGYNDDDDDEEDGPVIVPYDEFESSLSRSAALLNTCPKQVDSAGGAKHRIDYPLLFAAMSPQEDVVMCAARVLDEQRDVSLVREAAAYLEEVEAHRCSL